MVISTEVIIVRDCYSFVTILHHFRYFLQAAASGEKAEQKARTARRIPACVPESTAAIKSAIPPEKDEPRVAERKHHRAFKTESV